MKPDIATMIKKEGKGVLAGGDGTGDPEIKKGIVFNGIEDDAYETFELPSGKPKKGSGDFCKTNRKPYDQFVSASLLILKDYLGESISIDSDGSHSNGKALAKKYSKIAKSCVRNRPLVSLAITADVQKLNAQLHNEEMAERKKDIEYWAPLRQELEALRHKNKTRAKGL